GRLLERRRQALRLTADPKAGHLAKQLQATRQQLAHLLLTPSAHPERQTLVQRLSRQKEDLERNLARVLPAFQALQVRDRLTPADLLAQLPPGTAFVDLLRYVRFEQDPNTPGRKGERRALCYVAFVLQSGRPVQRVELKEAAPIEQALTAWRKE